jgi:hypothetical protein
MTLATPRHGRRPWLAAAAAIALTNHSLVASAATFESRIAAANDDVEEFANGFMYLHSSDLELVEDDTNQHVGMRWIGVGIPRGASITSAWIQFTAKSSGSTPTHLELFGLATDNAPAFTTTTADLSGRALTTADADWIPPAWVAGAAGADQRSPDLSAVIQAIVNRPGWNSGNALGIAVIGTGKRTAWAWDGDQAAVPLLHVEFDDGSPPPPPPPPPPPTGEPIALYLGYYDTHHPDHTRPKPDPWKGGPGVVFVGKSDSDGGWDSSCLMVENLTDDDIDAVRVVVDIGAEHFALWGTHTIPEHGKLILAQTAFENFDGSDTNEAGCFSCRPSDCTTKVSKTVPVITVNIGTSTTRYFDRDQVLNTKGVDAAGCPYTGGRSDESRGWTRLAPGSSLIAGPSGAVQDSTLLPSSTVVTLVSPVPNPARGSVMFRFHMPEAGPVQLGMYDVAGRLVRPCVDGWFDAGEYLKGLDLGGVQPGVYFAVLRALGGTSRTTFAVTR